MVGNLEVIDDNHAIISSNVGPEYFVTLMNFVDKEQIEPGCSVLLHNKVSCGTKKTNSLDLTLLSHTHIFCHYHQKKRHFGCRFTL